MANAATAPGRSDRLARLLPLGCGAIAFRTYVYTLAPALSPVT